MATRARFTGEEHPQFPGQAYRYLEGIPARNLSDEEYEALSPEDKKRVRDSDLYDVASPASAVSQPRKGDD